MTSADMPEGPTPPISRLRVPTEDEWPAPVTDLAQGFRDKLGFVPNVVSNFALLPDHFQAWWAYFDQLMRGPSMSTLTKARREMIAVVVSAANGCHY